MYWALWWRWCGYHSNALLDRLAETMRALAPTVRVPQLDDPHGRRIRYCLECDAYAVFRAVSEHALRTCELCRARAGAPAPGTM